MSQLTEELKRDHEEIVELLNKIKELGISSAEGKEMFLSAKKGLLAHLDKEDKSLYPHLKKMADNNQDLKRTLEIFAKDIKGVSKIALEFFTKYSQGGSSMEFAKDFGRLVGILNVRIRKEEKILYPEYDKSSL